MVNVYLFRTDTSTPADWSDVSSTYANRLILGNGTALETGGAATHNNHSLSGWSCSTVNAVYRDAADAVWIATTHNHASGTCSFGNGNHLPPYKTFRLVRRDLTGWNGKLPSGSVAFCETVPPTGYERIENGSSNFIMISGTAGSTGGALTHYHTYSGTTGGGSAGYNINTFTSYYGANSSHTHTYSGNSGTANNNPYFWSCGLIRSTSEIGIKTDMILLFDGTPSSTDWDVISGADNRYLKISSTNSIATGGAATDHTHPASGTTSDASAFTRVSIGSGTVRGIGNHSHTYSFTLSSVAPVPTYVRLILGKAKRNLGGGPRASFITMCSVWR